MQRTFLIGLFAISFGSKLLWAQNFAGDMALSKVLPKDEGWVRLSSGHGFTDGAASDRQGNFYFSGRRDGKASIFKITPDGSVAVYLEDAPGISGLQFSPDGKLFGTRWGKNDIVLIDESGRLQTIATGDHPNDLVITYRGHLYFTSNAGVYRLYDSYTPHRVASGLKSPNGISLSPDQGTLIVSEYGGQHVWAYRVEKDASLQFGEPYMTMRLPVNAEAAKGDGATTDVEGRYYVTSALGIQMFDATGRISGVIAKPSGAGISNVEFAGDKHQYLYVTAGGEIFRRLTKTRGVLFFEDPRTSIKKQ